MRLEAAPIGVAWLDALADEVAKAASLDGALSGVDRWAASIDEDEGFATLVFEAGFQSFLAGQLMVRAVELAPEEGEPGTTDLEATRALEGSFLGMPFVDALEFFRSKAIISEAEFDALEDRYKTGGFIARRLASDRLREVARQAIERILTTDVTPTEAARLIRAAEAEELRGLGISPSSNHYIDTVVRTNVQSSYGHGRWAAMNDPDVLALRPYQQYWTAGDARVRANHRAMHGLVFEAGSALAAHVAPPCGFNCRCSMTSLSARQFEARGLRVTTSLPAGAGPDPGWEAPPAPLVEA